MKKKGFGLGYSLVVHSILTYFICGALTTSGLNVFVSAFSNLHGWDSSALLSLSTLAGILGVLGSILMSQWIMRHGPRIVTAITLVLTGLAVILFGNMNSLLVFLICMACFHIFSYGYSFVGTNTVIGNWFPAKKGIVLGITTMGMPMASFLFVPILSRSFGAMGPGKALSVIGAVIIALGVVSWFWVRNTPEEVGLLPDNGKYPAPPTARPGMKSVWTVGALFKNRDAMFIAIGYGLLFLVTQGMVSQTVPYLMERGFVNTSAVGMLSVAAAIGMLGSFLWGVIDDRLGTKKASLVYCVWYVITFAILSLPLGKVVTIIGVVMLGASLGGIGNLMPSMILTVFGAAEFPSVNRVINSICAFVRAFAFAAVALGLKIGGSYRGAMPVLIALTVIALFLIVGIGPHTRPQSGARA